MTMGTWTKAELRPALARDDLIGSEVVARVARGFNANGGGMFSAHNIRGQVWSLAGSTMIGSRREVTYWIADGSHYYAAARSDLIAQCEAEWPSPVSGGMTDARCVESPALVSEGMALCATCADEVAS